MADPLLHITTRPAWQMAQEHGAYRADSLATEGFIHCSTLDQVAEVAEALYAGRTDLILLVIDPAGVEADIRFEDCYDSGQAFPHVYGPIALDAVVRVLAYRPGPDGRFPRPALDSRPVIDGVANFPAHEGQQGVVFASDGWSLLGSLYLTAQLAPGPTAVLLHGMPGIEKNVDLAHDLRQAGWNSLIFHYRGCWGSAGRYRFATQPRDVVAALDYLETCPQPQIDPQRIVLVGHSMGGWAAVLAGAVDRRVQAVAVYGAVSDPRTWTFTAQEAALEYTPWLQAVTPAELVAEWLALDEAFWPVAQVARLAPRPLLVIHGAADGVVPPEQARALYEAAGPPRQLVMVPGANHAFSWQRELLRRTLMDWLSGLGL